MTEKNPQYSDIDSNYQELIERLDRAAVPYTIHEHEPLGGAAHSAAATSFDPNKMVKTLAFKSSNDGWVLAALKAFDQIDYSALARACDSKRKDIRAATREEIEGELHLEIGGVGPVVIADDVTLIFDHAAARSGIIYCGSGRADRTLEIDGAGLCEAMAALPCAIARQRA